MQDCTGSQGSYISSATRNIEEICATIFQSGRLQEPEDLRVGLVAYRDHPPQDHTWVFKNFGFTSNISKVRQELSSLYATGGGDGPEAVTAGLYQALTMDWREDASKMVVLIADAPPHGIGEYGDGTTSQNSSITRHCLMRSQTNIRVELPLPNIYKSFHIIVGSKLEKIVTDACHCRV